MKYNELTGGKWLIRFGKITDGYFHSLENYRVHRSVSNGMSEIYCHLLRESRISFNLDGIITQMNVRKRNYSKSLISIIS